MEEKDNTSVGQSEDRIGFSAALHSLLHDRRSLWHAVLWNAACVAIGLMLLIATSAELDRERRTIQNTTMQEAITLGSAYAQYLARLLEQVDQTTLLLKYEWERSGRALKLEELLSRGIFASSQYAYVTIGDRNGVPLTGTLPIRKPLSMLERDDFQFHARNRSPELHVGKPILGMLSGRPVIPFTRRLETASGRFDGIALASVTPAFFASFYQGTNLGKLGMLALVGRDGVVRMTGIGGASDGAPSALLMRIGSLDNAGSGTLRSGESFDDRQARHVAWREVPGYPLIAVVGISIEERLAQHRQNRVAYRNAASGGGLLLLLAALGGTMFVARAAFRKQQLAEVRDVYRVATESGDEGFFMLRPVRDAKDVVVDFMVADCNERGAGFSGLTAAELTGRHVSAFYGEPYRSAVLDSFRHAMESGDFEDELKVPPESPLKMAWIRRKFVRSGKGLALTIRDISSDKAHEAALWRMANADALTALPNRNWLMRFLGSTLPRVQQERGMLALLFIDLDHFKDINDSLGHSVGDELLRLVASRLKTLTRPTDHVVRLGGDEFTVILEPIEAVGYASDIAERIAALFDTAFELSAGSSTIRASVGISLFPLDGTTAEILLKYSDIAMYHAKGEGGGRHSFYAPHMSEALRHRLETERALEHAVAVDQFVMFYQPRVCTYTGELHGLEALVRWNHPTRGLVPPLEFIALAEETGLILRLGELIVEKVCSQVAQWKNLQVDPVPVSINVSPRQFNHGDIARLFSKTLAIHHLNADLIEIEITESSMMGDADDVAEQLSALHKLGIKLLVDDFGTGYSSLSALHRLDMDILKVDRAFTAALDQSNDGQVFFRAIMSMANALDMQVVAEGVETAHQLRALQALGCYEIQGYLVSRPVPAEDIPALLSKRLLLPPELTAPMLSTTW